MVENKKASDKMLIIKEMLNATKHLTLCQFKTISQVVFFKIEKVLKLCYRKNVEHKNSDGTEGKRR